MSEISIGDRANQLKLKEFARIIEEINYYSEPDKVIREFIKTNIEGLPVSERLIYIAQLFTLIKPKLKFLTGRSRIEEEPLLHLIWDSDRWLAEFADGIIKDHRLDIHDLSEIGTQKIDEVVNLMILNYEKKLNEFDGYNHANINGEPVSNIRDYDVPSRATASRHLETDLRARELLKLSLAKELLGILYPNIDLSNLPPQDKFRDLLDLEPEALKLKVSMSPGYSRIPNEYQSMFKTN